MTPAGFVFWGFTWIPLFFIAILFALLMAAMSNYGPKSRRRESSEFDVDVTKPTKEESKADNPK